MLTFDDVKNIKRGKEAEVQEQSAHIAARKLEEIASVENQETQNIDQQNLVSDAQKIVQELQNNPDLNPEEVMASLPPVLEQAVLEQMGIAPQGEELEEPAIEGEVPMEAEAPFPEEQTVQRKL